MPVRLNSKSFDDRIYLTAVYTSLKQTLSGEKSVQMFEKNGCRWKKDMGNMVDIVKSFMSMSLRSLILTIWDRTLS